MFTATRFIETLTELAYFAGHYRYYSKDSREDMATFIAWANEFEELHKHTDWDVEHHMEQVESFFQKKHIEAIELNPALNKPIAVSLAKIADWKSFFADKQILSFEFEPIACNNGQDLGRIRKGDDREPLFWSVYARIKHEGFESPLADCLADCETEQQAKDLTQLLEAIFMNVIVNHKK